MSEPHMGCICPFCGNADAWAWNPGTAYQLGYGCECKSCGTRWNFPAASDITELDRIAQDYVIADSPALLSRYLEETGGEQP
jgi:hypothetical protein